MPPLRQNSQQQRETPPIVGWSEWYAKQEQTWAQGQHRLFVGPTQSGKTTLCRLVVRIRSYVVVLGTKPVDPSLDAYVREGYRRIEQWPPKKRDMEPDENGDVRLILWPKIKTRGDLRKHRGIYADCIDDIFVAGRWTLVVDEGLWVAGRAGLDLGDHISDTAYGSASNLVTMCLIVQRPSGVPSITWSSVSDAMIFHSGVTRDTRELASLGVYDPKDVQRVVQSGLKGRQFLDLPCRGGKEWSVSEVEL